MHQCLARISVSHVCYPGSCQQGTKQCTAHLQVRRKCETGAYNSPEDFAADMRQVFSNAHTYNKAGTDVYVMATTLAVRRLPEPSLCVRSHLCLRWCIHRWHRVIPPVPWVRRPVMPYTSLSASK